MFQKEGEEGKKLPIKGVPKQERLLNHNVLKSYESQNNDQVFLELCKGYLFLFKQS